MPSQQITMRFTRVLQRGDRIIRANFRLYRNNRKRGFSLLTVLSASSTDTRCPLFQIVPSRVLRFHQACSQPRALSKDLVPLNHAPAAPYPLPSPGVEILWLHIAYGRPSFHFTEFKWKIWKMRSLPKCLRIWSGRWESNPRPKLGKLLYCHCTTPARFRYASIIHNEMPASTDRSFPILQTKSSPPN